MIWLALALAAAHASTPSAAFALIDASWIAPARDSAAAREIIARATKALDRPPGAIPHLHTEGTLPGHGIRDISLVAKQDQPIALDLAWAWRLTGDRRYLLATARYLDAWVSTYQISFNPIDETGFDTFIMATDLTKPALPAALAAKLDGFWRAMASGYLDAMDAGARNGTNNWQSHRVKLAAMAAFETGDAGLIERAHGAYERQVAINILSDGSVTDFRQRDALHYVTYDLEPLLMAAASAGMHGEDWYTWRAPSGSSLPGAVRWLQPYADGTTTHIEFANSSVSFDRERAAAGDLEYAPHPWDRANAVRPFAIAALCDPAYRSVATRVSESTGRPVPGWISLLYR
jgi:hypothetical protein